MAGVRAFGRANKGRHPTFLPELATFPLAETCSCREGKNQCLLDHVLIYHKCSPTLTCESTELKKTVGKMNFFKVWALLSIARIVLLR